MPDGFLMLTGTVLAIATVNSFDWNDIIDFFGREDVQVTLIAICISIVVIIVLTEYQEQKLANLTSIFQSLILIYTIFALNQLNKNYGK